jgi:peptide/nickel transport system substrate-binding protein
MNRLRAPWTSLAAVLLAALAFGLPGCGSRGGASTRFVDQHPLPVDTMTFAVQSIGNYGGRFVFGETSGPKTFNGLMANETSSTDITSGRLFMALTDYDNETQRDTPGLAKSWDVDADGVTWTYHLRRGAAFSDGHPITSDDVTFSFAVALDSTVHPSVQDLLIQNGKKWQVTAPDSYTVVIRTPSPNALAVPTAGSVPIMPKHVLEPLFRAGSFVSAYNVSTTPDSIVTSGPWRVQQYVANEKTVLTRNPYWYGVDPAGHRLPYLNELVYLVVPDQDALDLKFRSGEVDGLDNPKPENYRWYADHQKDGNFTLYDLGPALKTNFFFFNLNRVRKPTPGKKLGEPSVGPLKYAWLSNPVFRRAVSMAINREAMIPSVFFGDGVKNWSTMTAGNRIWYDPDAPHWDYDVEQSKRLLASLGWNDTNGDGFLEDGHGNTIGFTLKTNSDNKLRVGMANFVRDDLAKVGIKVTLLPIDFNTLITNFRDDFDYEAGLLGLESATPPDPAMGGNVWRSSGPTHYWNVRQPKPETPQEARIDQLMDDIVGSTDLSKRKAAWREIVKTVNDQCWIEWLPTIVLKLPVRNRFGNLQPSTIPHRLLWNIDRVYVKVPARPA